MELLQDFRNLFQDSRKSFKTPRNISGLKEQQQDTWNCFKTQEQHQDSQNFFKTLGTASRLSDLLQDSRKSFKTPRNVLALKEQQQDSRTV